MRAHRNDERLSIGHTPDEWRFSALPLARRFRGGRVCGTVRTGRRVTQVVREAALAASGDIHAWRAAPMCGRER